MSFMKVAPCEGAGIEGKSLRQGNCQISGKSIAQQMATLLALLIATCETAKPLDRFQ
ncbi:hypothetical protein REC12_22070 [Desulfosporosinus sp. PR]|nr:hypothetical protein [Desulfosporosinus sp. PR]